MMTGPPAIRERAEGRGETPPARGPRPEAPPRLSRPIRVCFLIEDLGAGGTETQLVTLINNLDRSRVEPFLVLFDGGDQAARAFEPADCRVLRLGLKKLITPRAARRFLDFRRFLRRERVDVLRTYFPDSTYFGVLAGRLAGVPVIVRSRNNLNHWMTPTHRLLGRLLNGFVDATLCNSEAARQAVLDDERPEPHTVHVIENGVDVERFAHIPTFGPGRGTVGARQVGMVANLRRVKGGDVFIRAAEILARSFPEVDFHVAGEGPYRAELERLIIDRGLTGRFHLLGEVLDMPGFLARLDVAVLSSRAEGMPNAVLEYMAAGRPIVATSVGGTATLIEDGTTGLLVQPDDPDGLARAIERLLIDAPLATRLAHVARERARRRYGLERMVRRFEEFCRDTIEGRPSGPSSRQRDAT